MAPSSSTSAGNSLYDQLWDAANSRPQLCEFCKAAGIKVLKTDDARSLHRRLFEHYKFANKQGENGTQTEEQDTPACVNELRQLIENKFESLQSQLTCLPALKQSHDVLSDSVVSLRQEVAQLKQDNSEIRSRLRTLEEGQNHSVGVGMAVQELEARFAGATAAAADAATVAATAATADGPAIERKKTNLRLTNLPDCNSQADAEVLVRELLATLETDLTATAVKFYPVSYAAVASANAGDRPRTSTVVVSFADVQDKKAIYPCLKKLKGSKFHHTHVDDDLTPSQQAARKAQQETFQRLRREGKRPQWRGAVIFVDKRPYRQPPRTQRPASASSPASAPTAANSTTYTFLNPEA